MNKQQAKELIRDTFESPFIYRGNIIPDAFKQLSF